jgi:hypothetical protein
MTTTVHLFGLLVLLVVLVCLTASTSAQAQAQQQQQFVHPLTDMPGPSDDIETSFLFPDYDLLGGDSQVQGQAHKLPLGETISVLCHFSNDGVVPVNISAIMGSLNHVMDYRYHIQVRVCPIVFQSVCL